MACLVPDDSLMHLAKVKNNSYKDKIIPLMPSDVNASWSIQAYMEHLTDPWMLKERPPNQPK